jgi:hypothetical protein
VAGVVAPVVRNVQEKGLQAIGASVKALAKHAKDGTLAADDCAGATFTMTNLGSYGVRQFSAIVTPPQAGVLAVGAVQKRVVPNTGAWCPSCLAPLCLASSLPAVLHFLVSTVDSLGGFSLHSVEHNRAELIEPSCRAVCSCVLPRCFHRSRF